MTCPGPDPDLCTDQTPCPSCPVALDLGADACPAVQASCEAGVVGHLSHDKSTDTRTPGRLGGRPGVAPPEREVAEAMMVPRPARTRTTPRRDSLRTD